MGLEPRANPPNMKKLGLIILILLIGLSAFVFHIFSSTGYFREIENRNDFGPIYTEIDLPGVEDITIARDDSLVILSADDRAARRDGREVVAGLFLLDMPKDDFSLINLSEGLDFPFFPHGISIYPISPGKYSLMAINHVDGKHSVEKFVLERNSLTHIETIRDEDFISPNDLVLVTPDQFYFSNDHGYTSGLGVFAENYLGYKAASIGFYDGQSASLKAGSIAYANGMQFNESDNLLYVASPRGFMVKVYEVTENWDLNLREDIATGTGVDNIELDENGDLWIGSHPNLLAFASYAAGKKPFSPSEVIRINYQESQSSIESVFVDSGELMSASSVAVPWGDYLFIGNVMDTKVLVLKR